MNLQQSLSEHDSKIFLENLTEYLPIIFFETDSELKLKYSNNIGFTTFGYDINDLESGISILDLISKQNHKIAIQNIKILISNRNYNGNEYTGIKKNGETFPIFVFSIAQFLDDKFSGLQGIVIDLSFHTDLNEKIKKSEEKFRSIFESSPLGIGIVEFSTQSLIDVNESFASMLGYSKDEILNLKIRNITHPEDFENEVKTVINAMGGSETLVFEKRYLKKNGEIVWGRLHLNPKNLSISETEQYLGIIENITEHKLAQFELTSSKIRYKHLAESIKDVFFSFDNDFYFTYWNRQADMLYGKNYKEVIHKHKNEIFPELNGSDLDGFYSTVMKTGKPGTFITQTTLNNQEQYFEVNAHPYEKGLSVFLKDITERMLAEKKIKTSEEELKKLNASKDKFFSIVAHDLRSPFHGLIGISDILLEEFDELDRKSIREYLMSINKTTKNLFKLIENLLSWSRLQTGKIEYHPENIDLYEAILYSVNLLTPYASNKKITIINNIAKETLVYGDEKMIVSVLENLLSNAIKFSYPNSKIEIDCLHNEREIQISVKDYGVGLSDEEMRLLFKLDSGFSTIGTNNEKGTGFGLLICKDMIEKMGGKIFVNSKKNEGSIFTFMLNKNGG